MVVFWFFFLFAGSFLTLTPAFISRQIGAACSTRTSGAKGDASSELITSPNGEGGGPQVAPVTNEEAVKQRPELIKTLQSQKTPNNNRGLEE